MIAGKIGTCYTAANLSKAGQTIDLNGWGSRSQEGGEHSRAWVTRRETPNEEDGGAKTETERASETIRNREQYRGGSWASN